jgi:hypothetical protein
LIAAAASRHGAVFANRCEGEDRVMAMQDTLTCTWRFNAFAACL